MGPGRTSYPGEMSIADQERDDVLLRRAAKGDEEAFTLLYRRHQAALYRFALRMTGSTWAAEEIVQDVFMMLMRDPRKYDATRGTLGGFLYGVLRPTPTIPPTLSSLLLLPLARTAASSGSLVSSHAFPR